LRKLAIIVLEGFPLVEPKDDVAKMIVEVAAKNGLEIEDNDLIVVAQKIFSKSEGRMIKLKDVLPSEKAEELAKATKKDSRFIELVLRETKRIIKVSNEALLVEDKRGLICINAGIDKSNVKGRGNYALLPEDPDKSAEKCCMDIKKLTGKNVGVIISDTYSRPFRRGQVNFAIGIAGVNLFRDYRGKKDLFGQVLKVKNVAVVDEVAAAAELLMGQATEKSPVVILRGLDDVSVSSGESRTSGLFISNKEDLFRDAL
jgi:coenzyme F420-0:L-glutamate ligase/coenzyme F420-1:gamma-L-glutamate ligase